MQTTTTELRVPKGGMLDLKIKEKLAEYAAKKRDDVGMLEKISKLKKKILSYITRECRIRPFQRYIVLIDTIFRKKVTNI